MQRVLLGNHGQFANNFVLAVDAFDVDALAYIQRVETADGTALEAGIKSIINSFVIGCKADGIWDAIKSSAILAGARTLNGALQPLVGVAPTNFNFVSGDYDRKTGLVGNGTTKYLNSNRNTNADPQDSYSASVWISSAGTPANSIQLFIGANSTLDGTTSLGMAFSQLFARNRSLGFSSFGTSTATGFFGHSRNNSATYTTRNGGANTPRTQASQAPANSATHVFAETGTAIYRSNSRLAFYSIGESLDLALLDTRVTNLINHYKFFLYTAANPLDYDPDTVLYVNRAYDAGGTLA